MSEAVDILVITAHPDDAEFGVAGTVARWTREGKQVVYVVCTSGDKGTSDRSMKPERLGEIRKKEQKALSESSHGYFHNLLAAPKRQTCP